MNSPSPETVLVARLLAGDEAAFQALYKQYGGALYSICLKVLKDKEAAADAMQEGFVKIWLNIRQYDAAKGTLFTWMLNVVRNTAIDKHRSRSKQPEIQNVSAYVDLLIANDPQPDAGPDVLLLRQQVANMKPEHRQAVELTYLLGLTHEEAALRLQIPLGTLKSRCRAALQELKKLFN